MAVATFILASLFPVWMVAGGWLAVALYRRKAFGKETTLMEGAKLGAVAGLMGFGFFALVTSAAIALQAFVLHRGNQFRDLVRSTIERAASRNPDPQVQQMIQWMQTPEGLAFLAISSLVLLFFAFLLLGSLGGLVGASLGRRRNS